jgi:hypothetical protein
MKRTNKFGLSFSWKRAVGITSLKSRIARETGIPTTSAGRQRKLGRAVGCMTIALGLLALM